MVQIHLQNKRKIERKLRPDRRDEKKKKKKKKKKEKEKKRLGFR